MHANNIIALQSENILLRRLLEQSNGQTSDVLELLRKTTASLEETTASLERLSAKTETLLAQHIDLLSLAACIERDAIGGTLQ